MLLCWCSKFAITPIMFEKKLYGRLSEKPLWYVIQKMLPKRTQYIFQMISVINFIFSTLCSTVIFKLKTTFWYLTFAWHQTYKVPYPLRYESHIFLKERPNCFKLGMDIKVSYSYWLAQIDESYWLSKLCFFFWNWACSHAFSFSLKIVVPCWSTFTCDPFKKHRHLIQLHLWVALTKPITENQSLSMRSVHTQQLSASHRQRL